MVDLIGLFVDKYISNTKYNRCDKNNTCDTQQYNNPMQSSFEKLINSWLCALCICMSARQKSHEGTSDDEIYSLESSDYTDDEYDDTCIEHDSKILVSPSKRGDPVMNLAFDNV